MYIFWQKVRNTELYSSCVGLWRQKALAGCCYLGSIAAITLDRHSVRLSLRFCLSVCIFLLFCCVITQQPVIQSDASARKGSKRVTVSIFYGIMASTSIKVTTCTLLEMEMSEQRIFFHILVFRLSFDRILDQGIDRLDRNIGRRTGASNETTKQALSAAWERLLFACPLTMQAACTASDTLPALGSHQKTWQSKRCPPTSMMKANVCTSRPTPIKDRKRTRHSTSTSSSSCSRINAWRWESQARRVQTTHSLETEERWEEQKRTEEQFGRAEPGACWSWP